MVTARAYLVPAQRNGATMLIPLRRFLRMMDEYIICLVYHIDKGLCVSPQLKGDEPRHLRPSMRTSPR